MKYVSGKPFGFPLFSMYATVPLFHLSAAPIMETAKEGRCAMRKVMLLFVGLCMEAAVLRLMAWGLWEREVFPDSSAGGDLIAETMIAYEGGYLEDGSNREVVDIAALQLRNTGSRILPGASVAVQCAGQEYIFRTDEIPAYSTVLVLEKEGKKYPIEQAESCVIQVQAQENCFLPAESLHFEMPSMGMIRVKNCRSIPLPAFELLYKTYMPETGIYLGGITYSCQAGAMMPGETIELHPPHYARGYSRIIGIRM